MKSTTSWFETCKRGEAALEEFFGEIFGEAIVELVFGFIGWVIKGLFLGFWWLLKAGIFGPWRLIRTGIGRRASVQASLPQAMSDQSIMQSLEPLGVQRRARRQIIPHKARLRRSAGAVEIAQRGQDEMTNQEQTPSAPGPTERLID